MASEKYSFIGLLKRLLNYIGNEHSCNYLLICIFFLAYICKQLFVYIFF